MTLFLNGFALNTVKTGAICFGTLGRLKALNQCTSFNCPIHQFICPTTLNFLVFGVTLDCNLNFDSHISNVVCSAAYFLIKALCRICLYIDLATAKCIASLSSLDSTTRMPHFLVFQMEIFNDFSECRMPLHVLSWSTVLPVLRCSFHPSIGCLYNSAYATNL